MITVLHYCVGAPTWEQRIDIRFCGILVFRRAQKLS